MQKGGLHRRLSSLLCHAQGCSGLSKMLENCIFIYLCSTSMQQAYILVMVSCPGMLSGRKKRTWLPSLLCYSGNLESFRCKHQQCDSALRVNAVLQKRQKMRTQPAPTGLPASRKSSSRQCGTLKTPLPKGGRPVRQVALPPQHHVRAWCTALHQTLCSLLRCFRQDACRTLFFLKAQIINPDSLCCTLPICSPVILIAVFCRMKSCTRLQQVSKAEEQVAMQDSHVGNAGEVQGAKAFGVEVEQQ